MSLKLGSSSDPQILADLEALAAALEKALGLPEQNWFGYIMGDASKGYTISLSMRESGPFDPAKILIERRINPTGKWIEHELFKLHRDYQNKGLSDVVADFTRKQMERFGLETVKLHANLDVGGYAWLRKGFRPDVPQGLLSKLSTKTSPLYAQMMAEVKGYTDEQLYAWFLSPNIQPYKGLFLGSDWYGRADLTKAAVRKALFKKAAKPAPAASLSDEAIRHAVMLERLKAAEVRDFQRLVPLLAQQVEDVLTRLRVKSLSELQRGELNAVLRILQQAQQGAAAEATDKFMTRLSRLAEYEAGFEAETLLAVSKEAGVPLSVTAATPSAAWALANAVPLSATGDLLAPWVKDMTTAEIETINKVILRGFSEGWTNDDLLGILRGTKGMNYTDGLLTRIGKNNATIVRTAIQHVASTAREATWRANHDLIDKYKWVSTLDSRTSPQCRSLDGQMFELGKGPRPPIHPNCRSTTVVVLKGKLAVLSEGRTRASADGPVDGSMTYYEWLGQQPAAFQEEVLGPSRYKMFAADDMTADRFARLQLNKAFEPLTLDELIKRRR